MNMVPAYFMLLYVALISARSGKNVSHAPETVARQEYLTLSNGLQLPYTRVESEENLDTTCLYRIRTRAGIREIIDEGNGGPYALGTDGNQEFLTAERALTDYEKAAQNAKNLPHLQ